MSTAIPPPAAKPSCLALAELQERMKKLKAGSGVDTAPDNAPMHSE